MMLKVAGLLSLLGILLLLPGMIYVNTESDIKNFSWHLNSAVSLAFSEFF